MTQINLLPWREELRERKRKQFLSGLVASALCALFCMVLLWSFMRYQLDDQNQANQLISSSNEELDEKLKTIDDLQAQRNSVIERMRLIQGLQGQRPVSVRVLDEFVRIIPANMYLTRVTRNEDTISIEGRADNPDTVAILLRRIKTSPWFRNAMMSSFDVKNAESIQPLRSVSPRPEEMYGHFLVTVDVAELASTHMAQVAAHELKQQGEAR